MMPEVILNELSFKRLPRGDKPAAPNAAIARLWMSTLMECLREGRRRKWMSKLRVAEVFYELEISSGYGLMAWRNDNGVNRDERTLFRSIAAAYPYPTRGERDVVIEGLSSVGLACCVEMQGIAASLASDTLWENPNLNVVLNWLEASGELMYATQELRNISRTDHWGIHADSVRAGFVEQIGNGHQIMEMAELAFAHLEFCPSAIAQIEGMTGNERFFRWFVSALLDADKEVELWTDGRFPHERLPGPATGESKTVHQDKNLHDMRVFKTQDGRELMFEHHMKNNSENFRVHYIFEGMRSKLLIGYAGPHLPTGRY